MSRLIQVAVVLMLSIACRQAHAVSKEKIQLTGMEKAHKITGADSTRSRLYLKLAEKYLDTDSLRARQYLEKGTSLSKNSAYLYALSWYYRGKFLGLDHIETAMNCYKTADKLLGTFLTAEAYGFRARCWNNYAVLVQARKDNKQSLEIILNKCVPLARLSGDRNLLANIYLNVSGTLKGYHQYDKALIYSKMALDLLRQGPGEVKVIACLYLADIECHLKHYNVAGQWLVKARTLLADLPPGRQHVVYHTISGQCAEQQGNLKLALEHFNQGIALVEKPDPEYDRQELMVMKYQTLLKLKEFTAAETVLLYLLKQPDVMSGMDSRKKIYSALSATYEGMNQPLLTLKWQKAYSRLSDSIHESHFNRDLNALEIRFRNTEKEKEINVLKAQHAENALKGRNNLLVTALLITVILLLLLLLFFSNWYFRNKRKLLEQQHTGYKKHLYEMEQQRQLEFSRAMLQGEEQERRRLARDLHDGLGGMLAGIKISLSVQSDQQLSEEAKHKFSKSISRLDDAVTELRRIAHNMMPVNLLKFGLSVALKDLCESQMSIGTRISFQALGIRDDIPEQTQINIYRIVQEMLNNAIRHAQASQIILQCSQDKNTFLITMEDNGVGFDPDEAAAGNGLGLMNIRNRVGLLNGVMDIETKNNEGTIINIEVQVGS